MNGVFAVHKPAGLTSHDVVALLKKALVRAGGGEAAPARRRRGRPALKVGHGGALDPLAEGALVIGVGAGTKELAHYLGQCAKVYTAEARLGARTTTYDAEGEVLEYGRRDPRSVSDADVAAVVPRFAGEITQYPPVFSALKVDGKPLYAYAREKIPLPRPIERRACRVDVLEHGALAYGAPLPAPVADADTRAFAEHVLRRALAPPPAEQPPFEGATLALRMEVSSGTYIRSIINDVGEALETNAYMTKLVRDRQGQWELGKNVIPLAFFEQSEQVWLPVLQTVLSEGPRRELEPEVLQYRGGRGGDAASGSGTAGGNAGKAENAENPEQADKAAKSADNAAVEPAAEGSGAAAAEVDVAVAKNEAGLDAQPAKAAMSDAQPANVAGSDVQPADAAGPDANEPAEDPHAGAL